MLRAALAATALAAVLPTPQTPSPRLALEAADGTVTTVDAESLPADGRADLGALVVRVLTPAPVDPPPADEYAEIALVGGDRLAGAVAGGEGESLLFELAGGALVPLPIDALEALRFPERLPRDPGLVVEAPPEGDRLYRRVGQRLDRVDGAVAAFSAEGILFDGVVGTSLFGWEEVAALFVEPLGGAGDDVPVTSPVAVDLADGSRLRGSLVRVDRDGVELEVLPAGVSIFLRWRTLAEVSRADGSLSYLSEVSPALAVDAAPFGDDLGMVWPHRVDRAVTGGPLRAGGQLWTRGFGVHAPSRLEFDLTGEYRELRGAVAIDDSVLDLAQTGSVVFRVELDGTTAWTSPVVRGGREPLELPAIDLGEAERLALVVEEADRSHVADRADWLRLRLLR